MADPTQITTRDTSGANNQTTGSAQNDSPKPASGDNVDRFNKNMAPETPPAKAASGVAATQAAQIQGEDSPKPTTRNNDSEKVMEDRRDRGERTESVRDERGERTESVRNERGKRTESERPERMRDEHSSAVPAGNAKGSSASPASNDMPVGDAKSGSASAASNDMPVGDAKSGSASAASNDMSVGDAKGGSDGAKPTTSGGDGIPHPNDLLAEFASEQEAAGNSKLDLPPGGFSKSSDSGSFVYSTGGSAKASGSNSTSSSSLEADGDNNVSSGFATTTPDEDALTVGKIAGSGEGQFLGIAETGEKVQSGLELVNAGSSNGNQGPIELAGSAFANKDNIAETSVGINDPDAKRGDSLAGAIAKSGDSVKSSSAASEGFAVDASASVKDKYRGDNGTATAEAIAGPELKAAADANDEGGFGSPVSIDSRAVGFLDGSVKASTIIDDPDSVQGDSTGFAGIVAGPETSATASAKENNIASARAGAFAYEQDPEPSEAIAISIAGDRVRSVDQFIANPGVKNA